MKKLGKKPSTQQQKIQPGICQQNFKIFLRIKPPHVQDPNHHILKVVNSNKVQITSPYYSVSEGEKIYSYQEIFDDNINNNRVFQQTMINPIANVLQGYNSTVFIYGMTGSGKTYTMFGSIGSGTSKGLKNEQDGLVSMTIDHMFNQIQKQSHIKSQISISFYEIYNENIRDLLQQQQQGLTIMQDPVRGVFVNGLAQVLAEQKNQIKDVIYSGIQRRSMNATKLNEVSSRSHAILQFIVKRYIYSNQNQATVLESKFFMIDLAGNQKTANNQSRRFIEGVNINKSLLTLGKCLSILADRKSAYVPFRDSKLTRILKQSLGGNSKTVMIACVSSQRRFYEQTLNTLKYSTIAKRIKNKGVKHNIKLISKDEVPDQRNCLGAKLQCHRSDMQNNIKQTLATFLAAVQAKIKIQKLQQDLQISRKQNQQLLQMPDSDHETCKRNIKKINDTIQLLMRPYEKQMDKLQSAYHQLMDNVNQIIKKQKDKIQQNPQITALKQIITAQNKKIKQYEQKLNMSSAYHIESISQQFQNKNKIISNHKQDLRLITPSVHKQNIIPVFNLSTKTFVDPKSQSKNKRLTINIGQNQDGHRSASVFQNLSNSNISNNSSRMQKKSNNFQRQIVINLNADQIQKKSHQSSRDQFVKKLKQTEKKAKGVQSQQILNLLKEQQLNRYQLGNVQMSMIRKLKFFQRQKSLQKSNSLGKILTRTPQPNKMNLRKF